MFSTRHGRARQERRIAITGMGVVSPLGRTTRRFWEMLTQPAWGNSCSENDAAERARGIAEFDGRIEDFEDLPVTTRKSLRKSLKVMNRETQMGVAAGQQALLGSRLLDHYDAERVGVCFGAGNVSVMPEDFTTAVGACVEEHGEFDPNRWGTDGLSEMAPLWLLKCLPNMPACHLAILNDLRGPNNTITQREVSFGLAIAEACRNLKSGDADAMLVGATGTTLHAINLMHARFENEICDDFDHPDDGTLDMYQRKPFPGEGAGALVLEDLHRARDRGACIHGEVLGSATAAYLGHEGAAVRGQEALASAMQQSLRQAGLVPSDVGHIHAHEFSSESMKRAVSHAIIDVFGSAAFRIPVVSTKNRMGDAGAGAAGMETVASLLALENRQLFPVGRCVESNRGSAADSRHHGSDAAGDSFLSLSMFGRGLGNCIAIAAYRE